ncbi:MAG: hypothetical protein EXS09_06265 [Gemmataceae bacterium]|nr:hypothetical protein [Gemmataceae bacterium]
MRGPSFRESPKPHHCKRSQETPSRPTSSRSTIVLGERHPTSGSVGKNRNQERIATPTGPGSSFLGIASETIARSGNRRA